MKRKVEFIESYIKVGNDYQWNDNHGELIRCKNCKYYEETDETIGTCLLTASGAHVKGYCAWAERKETA